MSDQGVAVMQHKKAIIPDQLESQMLYKVGFISSSSQRATYF